MQAGVNVTQYILICGVALWMMSLDQIAATDEEMACHLPATNTSRPNRGPLEFQFSEVTFAFRTGFLAHSGVANVDTYIYHMYRDCVMVLFILLKEFKMPKIIKPYIKHDTIKDWVMDCDFVEHKSNAEKPLLIILKFLDIKRNPFGPLIPDDWYNSDRAILALKIAVLPNSSTATIRCHLDKESPSTSSKWDANLTIEKIGCPSGFYGNDCKFRCPCWNHASCHTYYAQTTCYCQPGYSGRYCEYDMTTLTLEQSSTLTPPSTDSNSPSNSNTESTTSFEQTNGHAMTSTLKTPTNSGIGSKETDTIGNDGTTTSYLTEEKGSDKLDSTSEEISDNGKRTGRNKKNASSAADSFIYSIVFASMLTQFVLS